MNVQKELAKKRRIKQKLINIRWSHDAYDCPVPVGAPCGDCPLNLHHYDGTLKCILNLIQILERQEDKNEL